MDCRTMNRKALVQIVTLSRILLASAVAVLTTWGDETWAVWASLAIIVICELTDLIDGMLARRWKVVSDFGRMLDPYADSVSRVIIYWSLARMGRTWEFVFIVMAARDVLVAFIRLNLASAGRDVGARRFGKLKAMIQGLCAILLMSGPLYWGYAAGLEAWMVPVLSLLVVAATLTAFMDHLVAAWPLLVPHQL